MNSVGLPRPAIAVWDTAGMTEEKLRCLTDRLPPDRRAEVAACRRLAQRQMAAGVSLLAYFVLAHHRELPAGEVTVMGTDALAAFLDAAEPGAFAGLDWRRGEHGKPFWQGVPLHGGRLFLSLSHSDGFAGVAVSPVPVGFDLQRQRPMPADRLRRIAARFHPEESAALSAMDEAAFCEEFWRVWAAKESVLKLTGEGLARPFASFCVRREGEDYLTRVADRPVRVRCTALPEAAAVMAAAVFADSPTGTEKG